MIRKIILEKTGQLGLLVFDLALPLAIVVLTVIIGYVVRAIVFSRLERWSKKTDSKIDDIIAAAMRSPFIIWFLMLGIYLAAEISVLPANAVRIVGKILLVLGIFSVTLALVNLVAGLIKIYAGRFENVLPITSLTQNISSVIIFGIGILIILNTLGISIAPILATLGIGGLAVALALQDTLANIFAGFYITMARQLRIGDYIMLDSGQEGYITDINWRSTKIRTLSNNIILVPNDKLTKAIATNFYLPDKQMAVLVNVGVHYNSNLNRVETITCEVAREVMKEVPGGVRGFEPGIRYHTFGDSSINFTVALRANEFTDQYLVKHEFIKRLHQRYAQEGITIPYPIRAINYQQEKQPPLQGMEQT